MKDHKYITYPPNITAVWYLWLTESCILFLVTHSSVHEKSFGQKTCHIFSALSDDCCFDKNVIANQFMGSGKSANFILLDYTLIQKFFRGHCFQLSRYVWKYLWKSVNSISMSSDHLNLILHYMICDVDFKSFTFNSLINYSAAESYIPN